MSSYEGKEHKPLKNWRKMKAKMKTKSDWDMAAGERNKGKVLLDTVYSETTSAPATGTRINIMAPPSKLGIIVDSPSNGGLPYVSDVQDYCPTRDKIGLDNRR